MKCHRFSVVVVVVELSKTGRKSLPTAMNEQANLSMSFL
jgi:hypothetical protein